MLPPRFLEHLPKGAAQGVSDSIPTSVARYRVDGINTKPISSEAMASLRSAGICSICELRPTWIDEQCQYSGGRGSFLPDLPIDPFVSEPGIL